MYTSPQLKTTGIARSETPVGIKESPDIQAGQCKCADCSDDDCGPNHYRPDDGMEGEAAIAKAFRSLASGSE